MHMAARQIEKSVIVNLNRCALVKTAKARRHPHIILMRRRAFKTARQTAGRIDLLKAQMFFNMKR